MLLIPRIEVRHPLPFDIVGNTVKISGLSHGLFESNIVVQILDGNNQLLKTQPFTQGGQHLRKEFHLEFVLEETPATPSGTLHVFDTPGSLTEGVGRTTVTRPVVFGENLVQGYAGYSFEKVASGDTLSKIAQRVYGDATLYPRIFEANRNLLSNPNQVQPGQILRIPQKA